LFNEVFEKLIVPMANPSPIANHEVLHDQDGCRACLPLSDLLADNVMFADALNGNLLSEKSGAPLQIIARDHYGYKSIKYLYKIELIRDADSYRPSGPKFMEHPRARFDLEVRGRSLPE
jgi:DMSO/TMAO reductase YedYZ molybdopterin-dependent catalytic subunit